MCVYPQYRKPRYCIPFANIVPGLGIKIKDAAILRNDEASQDGKAQDGLEQIAVDREVQTSFLQLCHASGNG